MKKITTTLTGIAFAIGQSPHANAVDLNRTYDASPVSLGKKEPLSCGILPMFHLVFEKLIRRRQRLGFEGNTVRFSFYISFKFHSVTRGHQRMFFLG